jgi:hypothetical protein
MTGINKLMKELIVTDSAVIKRLICGILRQSCECLVPTTNLYFYGNF